MTPGSDENHRVSNAFEKKSSSDKLVTLRFMRAIQAKLSQLASPSSGNNDDEMRKAESAVAGRFMRSFQAKFDALEHRTDFTMGKEETRIRWDINHLGLFEGAAAGIITVALLRGTRSIFMGRLMQPKKQSQQGSAPSSKFHVQNNPFQQESSKPSTTVYSKGGAGSQILSADLFGWTSQLDLMVGLTVAASTALFFTDQRSNTARLSIIPLASGKSAISEQFCPAALNTYKEIMLQHQTVRPGEARYMRGPKKSPTLQDLLVFTENCQRRAVYEKQLRQDYRRLVDETHLRQDLAVLRQRGDHTYVEIPPPGVPNSSVHNNNILDELLWDSGPVEMTSIMTGGGDFYDSQGKSFSTGDNNLSSFAIIQEKSKQ